MSFNTGRNKQDHETIFSKMIRNGFRPNLSFNNQAFETSDP